jgi:putative ABC transport system permease protein
VAPLHRKLLRDLWRLKAQVVAIAAVIASGVALLVMSLVAIDALQATVSAFYDQQRFGDLFASVRRAPASVVARIAALDGVQLVEARIVRHATIEVAGFDEPVTATLVSVPRRGGSLLNRTLLVRGQPPASADAVLVSEAFADAHALRVGDRLSVLMNGHRQMLTVAGVALSPEFVYTMPPGGLMPDAKRAAVLWMDAEALAAAYDLHGSFDDVVARLLPSAHVERLIAEVDALLAPWGGTGAYARRDQLSNWFVMNEITQLETMAAILPAIFLAVAAFLVNVVMARLVAMERSEIGLLKAFGYADAAVLWHYAQFVLLIALAGVLLGAAGGHLLGRWVTALYADVFRLPDLGHAGSLRPFLVAGGISIAAALAGGTFAAWRAAALAPAAAMRPPAPPRFSHRGTRLLRHLDQPTRIILRQVARRPLRAWLTSLGAAASVAVLVSALQWLDAVDVLMASYFHDQQRQDVTLALVTPRRDDVLRAAARLPGVQHVEGQRLVAARLHHGQYARRQAIIGAPPDGVLEVLAATGGVRARVPPHGLLLSSALADTLHASVGDQLVVEVLEGARPTLMLPVAAVFETWIGSTAYMDAAALAHAVGEPGTVNRLLLRVDPAAQASLLAATRDLPALAAATSRHAALAMFDATMADTILVYVSFYVFFAATLAVGVVYNNMRISLSERGRELATLRVLGLGTGEVGYVLLGEAALLVTLALPVGCLLGHGLGWLMAEQFATELFRVPLVVRPDSYAIAALVTLAAAVASGAFLWRRLRRLDLIAVLKTRE